jgi:hypothetical protein
MIRGRRYRTRAAKKREVFFFVKTHRTNEEHGAGRSAPDERGVVVVVVKKMGSESFTDAGKMVAPGTLLGLGDFDLGTLYPGGVQYVPREDFDTALARIETLELLVKELAQARSSSSFQQPSSPPTTVKRLSALEDAVSTLGAQVEKSRRIVEHVMPTLGNTVTSVHNSMTVVVRAWRDSHAALIRFVQPVVDAFALDNGDTQAPPPPPPIGPMTAVEAAANAAFSAPASTAAAAAAASAAAAADHPFQLQEGDTQQQQQFPPPSSLRFY